MQANRIKGDAQHRSNSNRCAYIILAQPCRSKTADYLYRFLNLQGNLFFCCWMKKGWNEENISTQRPSLYSPTMRTRGDVMNSQMRASRSVISGAMNTIHKNTSTARNNRSNKRRGTKYNHSKSEWNG